MTYSNFTILCLDFYLDYRFNKKSISDNRRLVFKTETKNPITRSLQDIAVALGINSYWDSIKFSPFKTYDQNKNPQSLGESYIDLKELANLDFKNTDHVKHLIVDKVLLGTLKDLLKYIKSMAHIGNYKLYQHLQKYVFNGETLAKNGLIPTLLAFLIAYAPWMMMLTFLALSTGSYRILTVSNPGKRFFFFKKKSICFFFF